MTASRTYDARRRAAVAQVRQEMMLQMSYVGDVEQGSYVWLAQVTAQLGGVALAIERGEPDREVREQVRRTTATLTRWLASPPLRDEPIRRRKDGAA